MTALHQQQQQRRENEAEQRREQQRVADIRHLAPVDAGGAVLAAQHRIGDADADDRADQRVRARGRQAEPPGAEVPDDRRDQQREHHRVAGAGADLQDEFDRQQRNDAEGHRAGRGQDAEQVEAARPDHRDLRLQRVGVDDGRHRVGGVVEAVDEFEAERDQHRQAEQQERHDRRRTAAGAGDVRIDRIGHEKQGAGDDGEKNQHRPNIERLIEMDADRRGLRCGARGVGDGGHVRSSPGGGAARGIYRQVG